MSIIKCSECGKEISDKSVSCVSCGAPIRQKGKKSGCAKSGCLVIVAFLFIAILVPNIVRRSEGSVTEEKTAKTVKTIEAPAVSEPFWTAKYFVDEFGTKLNEKYTGNTRRVIGSFSNTATQNSPLGVDFIITNQNFSIKLYEYNRNVPVKFSIEKEYTMNIACDGKRKDGLRGELVGDRVMFSASQMFYITEFLVTNKAVKFYLTNNRITSEEYKFEIPDNNKFTENLP